MPRAPQDALTTIPREDIVQILTGIDRLRKLPRCRTDEEIESRINEYFTFCVETGNRPGVEGLCLSLGIVRSTLFNWCNGQGCSAKRTEMCRLAKQTIVTYIEQAGLAGKLNPVSQIFILKNWANYKDSYDITNEGRQGLQPSMSPDEIQRKIEADIPLDALDGDYTEIKGDVL